MKVTALFGIYVSVICCCYRFYCAKSCFTTTSSFHWCPQTFTLLMLSLIFCFIPSVWRHGWSTAITTVSRIIKKVQDSNKHDVQIPLEMRNYSSLHWEPNFTG